MHGREPRHTSTPSRAAARAPRCCPEVCFERVDEPRLGSGCLGRRQAGGLSEQQTFVSSQFRRPDEPDRGLAGSASGEGRLLSSQTATFSLRPCAGAESGGRESERESKRAWGGSSLAPLLIRTLMGSDQAHPPEPRFTLITSSEASLPNGYPGGQDVSVRTVGSTQILVL